MTIDHIQGHTTHARRGALKNAFRYSVDYVLIDLAEHAADAPVALLSRNHFNLWSIHDRHHGGERGQGIGMSWFQDVLSARGFPLAKAEILLLTQPNFLWFHFNPVSFWIALIDGEPCAFVAEVNNTVGDRHCYFCAHDDFRPITPSDQMHAEKLMHVSPFQTVEGAYRFNFSLTDKDLHIRIAYENGDQGVIATLFGPRAPVSNRSLLWGALRRPLGAGRVVALILWQALILKLKGARFHKRKAPPDGLLSEGSSSPVTHQ